MHIALNSAKPVVHVCNVYTLYLQFTIFRAASTGPVLAALNIVNCMYEVYTFKKTYLTCKVYF